MKTRPTPLLLAAALMLGAAATASAEAAKPKVVGLLFYADWCSSCKVLEPKLDAIKKDFAGQPVLFTRVDFTDDFTKEQSDLLASYMGIDDAYVEQGRKTGFMLLIDTESKQVLGRLVKTQSEAELKAGIEAALKG
ncbi:MAG TPA: thioredoxin domain-containing protein [Opitutaceae bacterium]